MQDSRKGKRSRKKGLPTPDPHVDGGNGKRAIVYNTKREKRERGRTKRLKKYNSKMKEFSTLNQNIRACPMIFFV